MDVLGSGERKLSDQGMGLKCMRTPSTSWLSDRESKVYFSGSAALTLARTSATILFDISTF
jgi:hypothetical protein